MTTSTGSLPDIRLIAVDLDGTLLTRDHTPAVEGARALATTRTPPSVRRFAGEIGLMQPLICTNGAQIFAAPDGPTWVTQGIAKLLARAVVDLADRRGWSLVTTVDEMTYYRQQSGEPLGPTGDHREVVATNGEALARAGEVVRMLNYEPDAIPNLPRPHAGRRPGAMQGVMGAGDVDFGWLIAALREHSYEGAVAIEYFNGFDADFTSTRALRARLVALGVDV